MHFHVLHMIVPYIESHHADDSIMHVVNICMYCFDVLGINWWPTDRVMITHSLNVLLLREKHT